MKFLGDGLPIRDALQFLRDIQKIDRQTYLSLLGQLDKDRTSVFTFLVRFMTPEPYQCPCGSCDVELVLVPKTKDLIRYSQVLEERLLRKV